MARRIWTRGKVWKRTRTCDYTYNGNVGKWFKRREWKRIRRIVKTSLQKGINTEGLWERVYHTENRSPKTTWLLWW